MQVAGSLGPKTAGALKLSICLIRCGLTLVQLLASRDRVDAKREWVQDGAIAATHPLRHPLPPRHPTPLAAAWSRERKKRLCLPQQLQPKAVLEAHHQALSVFALSCLWTDTLPSILHLPHSSSPWPGCSTSSRASMASHSQTHQHWRAWPACLRQQVRWWMRCQAAIEWLGWPKLKIGGVSGTRGGRRCPTGHPTWQ